MIAMRYFQAESKMLGLAKEDIGDVTLRLNQSDIQNKEIINIETVFDGKKFKGLRVWYRK